MSQICRGMPGHKCLMFKIVLFILTVIHVSSLTEIWIMSENKVTDKNLSKLLRSPFGHNPTLGTRQGNLHKRPELTYLQLYVNSRPIVLSRIDLDVII